MKAVLFLAVVVAAGAAQDKSDAPKLVKGGKAMTVEVVSANADAKTITVRRVTDVIDEGAPASHILPVDGKATASLSSVKAGDKVTLTCQAEAPRGTEPRPSDQTGEETNCRVTGIEKLPAR
jgi:hypothetical protein